MKKIFLVLFFIGVQSAQLAAAVIQSGPDYKKPVSADILQTLTYNDQRFSLLQGAGADTSAGSADTPQKKSGVLAAVLSAAVPGAGEYYAESYWKSALFAAIEVTAWVLYINYRDKGKSKDTQMRRFGNEKWSPQRYWTNLYNDAVSENKWTGGTPDFDPSTGYLTSQAISDQMAALRDYEKTHTHTLPATRTQQYYEMIYKYLSQFGAGWIELGDNWDYYDNGNNLDNLTHDVAYYRKLRNTSNGFYEVATAWATAAMFNHVASAFDAAFTVKFYNRDLHYSIIAVPKYYAGEQVTSYGVAVTW